MPWPGGELTQVFLMRAGQARAKAKGQTREEIEAASTPS